MADCNKIKNTVSEIGEMHEIQKKIVDDKFDKEQPQPHFLKGEDGKSFHNWADRYLISKYGRDPGRPWTSKEWREGVKAAFKSKESGGKNLLKKYPGMTIDSAMLSSEIISLVNDKIWLQDIVNTIYWELLPEYRPIISSNNGGQIDLATLPLTVLKPIFKELLYVSSAVETGGTIGGSIGYMRLKFNTPKQYAKHIGSEGYYNLADSLQNYNDKISSVTKDFMRAPKNLIVDGKRIKRNYGYQDILNQLNDFTEEIDSQLLQSGEAEEAMISLFTRLSLGWMYIDKNGNLMIMSEYKGTGKKYKSTGDSIKALMNPIKIEDYNVDNEDLSDEVRKKIRVDKLGNSIRKIWSSLNKKKKDYLINGKGNKKGLIKLTEMFREIDNNVLLFFEEKTNESIDNLVKALNSLFGNVLSPKDIRKIFFEKNYKKLDVFKNLPKDTRDTIDLLYATFSQSAMIKLAALDSSPIEKNPNFRRNHFPVSYYREHLPDLYNRYIEEVTERLEMIVEELPGLTGEDRIALKAEQRSLKYGLAGVMQIKENWSNDLYHIDNISQQTMPLARDNVFVNHITGAFDIRNMRQDSGAYIKNLRDRAAIVERNNLTTDLIYSLIKENRPEVRDNMINMYKGKFGRPDTIGGLFFWEGSSESYSNMIGNTISPKSVQRTFQLFTSFISGRYLSGLGTAAQNYSAIVHAIHARGIHAYVDARKALENHTEAIYEMIDASGVIDFSEYYSSQLVSDLSGTQVEAFTENIIIGAMINYHGRLSVDNSAKGKEEALKEFEENIQRALEESKSFMDSIPIPDDLSEIYERKSDNKYSRIRAVVNKYVDWAITKRFEYSKIYNTDLMPRYERVSYKFLGTVSSIYLGLFSTGGPLENLTMSTTEKSIRVISFIMGVQAAMQPGGPLEKTSFDNLTGEQFDMAVNIGRRVAREINYGMTKQDIGQVAQGEIGATTSQFKIWYYQNMGKDIKRFKRFYQSLQSLASIDDNRVDWSVILKMWPVLFTNQRKLRSTNPAAAQLKSFLVGSGLFTIMATGMVLAPIGIGNWVILNKISRALLGNDLRKYMGSLYSDLLALTVILPAMISLAFLADMDEEEEFDTIRFIQFFIRKLGLGWGPNYGIDTILNLVRVFLEENFGPAQYTGKVLSPVLGSRLIEQGLENLVLKPIDKVLAE